jgi:TetR/AcrR family tetracycline transcriptional repressor
MAPALPLTRDRIVDEALAMAHERGVDAVTLRPLAARLGVGASAIYRHVAGRDELLSLMHARLIDGRRRQMPHLPWDDGLRMLATGVWHIYAPYPGLAGEALAGHATTETSRERAADQVDALVAAGFPREEAESAVVALVQWVLVFMTSIDRHPAPETRIAEMPGHQYFGPRDTYDSGVDLMLDGLRYRLERHRG